MKLLNHVFPSLLVLILSCHSAEPRINLNQYHVNYNAILDSILPHFAKRHDSIPAKDKFLAVHSKFMQSHKKERNYEWLNYCEHTDGYVYFLISRLEPSMKNDKYAGICGRFKKDKFGNIDQTTYEELFWTWKMKKDELLIKSEILLKHVLTEGQVDEYLPGKSDGDWVEFPGNGVVYDKTSQEWIQLSK